MLRLDDWKCSALRELSEKFLPQSAVLFNMLSIKSSTTLRGAMNQPLEIFVDDWPNPAVVVIRSKSKWGNISNYPTVYTFSLHEEFEEFAASDKLMSVFLETCKDYNGFILNCWPLAAVDLLKESLNKLDNGNLELKVFGSTRTFWIPPVDQETLRKTEVTLPDGFQFDELLPQEAEMVDSLWVHRFDGSVDHVRRFIVLMPNVCVRKSDGKLAGFAMVHDFMGNEVHLFTMPEFRVDSYVAYELFFARNESPDVFLEELRRLASLFGEAMKKNDEPAALLEGQIILRVLQNDDVVLSIHYGCTVNRLVPEQWTFVRFYQRNANWMLSALQLLYDSTSFLYLYPCVLLLVKSLFNLFCCTFP